MLNQYSKMIIILLSTAIKRCKFTVAGYYATVRCTSHNNSNNNNNNNINNSNNNSNNNNNNNNSNNIILNISIIAIMPDLVLDISCPFVNQ
jgi:hypothetical protein